MKKQIYPISVLIPNLIEYMPTNAEANEIDSFEARKSVDFKRMVLENLNQSDTIGIPVPIGYDDIMVI